MSTKPDENCSECGGSGSVMGFGYGSDGGGGVRQCPKVMACQSCIKESGVTYTSENLTISYTDIEGNEIIEPLKLRNEIDYSKIQIVIPKKE